MGPFTQFGPIKCVVQKGIRRIKAGVENVAIHVFPLLSNFFTLHLFLAPKTSSYDKEIDSLSTIESKVLCQISFPISLCDLTMPTNAAGTSLSSYKYFVATGTVKFESLESAAYEIPRKRKSRSDSAAAVNLMSGNSISSPKKLKSHRPCSVSNPRISVKVHKFNIRKTTRSASDCFWWFIPPLLDLSCYLFAGSYGNFERSSEFGSEEVIWLFRL